MRVLAGLVALLAWSSVRAAEPAAGRTRAGGKPNHLAGQTSPYLLQHLYNPIDWYPWGDEALQKAKKEDRPIFLSIGYSACHWCHVMEREAFSDPEVARVLNERFVSIKVDREERPDLDDLYMTAVVAMTGRGGWPMSVLLTPEGVPFHGGSYYPADALRKLLASVADAWTNHRSDVLSSAGGIRAMLNNLQHPAAPPAGADAAPAMLQRAAAGWKAQFDAENGGFGGAPKFPSHGGLRVLLQAHRVSGDPQALDMVVRTLDAMARGGLYDQLGGGFHRYATDDKWLVPHFEKMLYDNALLVPVYLEAWKATGREDFRRVGAETLAWAEREMTDPQGGFDTSLDADSETEEGRYYVWTRADIETAVGRANGSLAADYFGATAAGNLGSGRNVLHVPVAPEEFARRHGLTVPALRARVDAARRRLLEVRSHRARPARDDKVLTAWNGLMISACARSFALTGSKTDRQAGERAARFALKNLGADDVLRVSWRQGQAGPPGLLDDYAFLARGLLDLYDATSDVSWRNRAARLVRSADRFLDWENGGYYSTPQDRRDLIVRPKSLLDDALPSGNAILVECLLRLARTGGDAALLQRATRTLDLAAASFAGSPTSYSYMVLAAQSGDAVTRPPEAPAVTGLLALAPPAEAATRTADGEAPRAAAGADRSIIGTIVGRANPQRVVATSLSVPDRPVRPGQAVTLSLRLEIQAGWHVNSSAPNLEYLIPTKIEFPDPGVVLVDQVVYPEARLVTLKFADTKLSVYEGANAIRATIHPPRDSPPGEKKVRARLTYQSCSDTTCLAPETVEFLVPLRIEGDPVAPTDMGPAAGAAAADGGAGRRGASPGGLATGGNVAAVLAEKGMLSLLGLVFLGGLALNLTPCVYPMMPVTIGFFAAQSRTSWLARAGLPALYVLGMAVTYSVLGMVAGRAGGLIGSTLQSAWVVGGLVVLFVVMALSMFGLFEVRLPGSLTRLGGGRRGPIGALVMGLTVGLVAAPCIGPFVVGLLAFVGASGNPILGFWLFFVMAIGMGLPNLVLGVFSGSLSSLPRSGEWLLYAKKVMGVALLGVAIYFLQPFLADREMGLLVLGFALAAGAYLAILEKTRLAWRLFPALKVAVGLLVVAMGLWFSMPLLVERQGAEWEPYSHEAFARASAAGKPILIDFSAEWCLSCKELERFTFADPQVRAEAARYDLLKADLTQYESPAVREIRDRFDIIGLPTIVFVDSAGNERRDLRVYGFEDAGAFLARMRQVR